MSWDFAALRELQASLAGRIELADRLDEVRLVAATDISAGPFATTVWAAVVVCAYPGLELLETVCVRCPQPFPYLTGLLGFREVPPLLGAFARLSRRPQLVLADGQGLAHPRRLGLACHLGLELDLPAIGCAKSRLLGEPAGELPDCAGAAVSLVDDGQTVGFLYRGRKGCKPLWVSPGHRVGLASTLEWVRRLSGPHRLPEPLRQAHLQANRARRGELESVELPAGELNSRCRFSRP